MSKRKAATAVEQEVPGNTKKLRPLRYVQYKCNLQNFWTTITENRREIGKKAWDRLKKCPFWGFIKPFYDDKITKDQVSKSDELISRLVSFYDAKNAWFVFGDRRMHTTAADVQRTFGIPNQGKHMDVSGRQSKGKTEFITRNFSGCDKVLKADIDAALKNALKEGDKEDVAALLILGLLASFLLCSSGASMSWNIVNLITPDLATLKQFNWAEAVAESLTKGLSRVEKDKPTALSGCVMLVMYWVCDNTAIMTPIPGREREEPTFVKWGLPKLHASMLEISDEYFEGLFKEEKHEVEVERLTPNPTFAEWVFPSSQEMKEELLRTKDAMESILGSIEPATSKMNKDGIIDAHKTVVELKKLKMKLEDRITELGEKIEELEGDRRIEVHGAAQDDEEFKAGASAAEVQQPSQENVEENNQEVPNEEDFQDQSEANAAEAEELQEQEPDKDTELREQELDKSGDEHGMESVQVVGRVILNALEDSLPTMLSEDFPETDQVTVLESATQPNSGTSTGYSEIEGDRGSAPELLPMVELCPNINASIHADASAVNNQQGVNPEQFQASCNSDNQISPQEHGSNNNVVESIEFGDNEAIDESVRENRRLWEKLISGLQLLRKEQQ